MPPSGWRTCAPRSASAAGSDQHDSIFGDVELVCRCGRQRVRSGCAGVGLPGHCPIGRCGDRPGPGAASALGKGSPMKLVPAGRLCLPVVPGWRRCAGSSAGNRHRRAGPVAISSAGRFAQRPCCRGQGRGCRDRNTARRHGDGDRWCLIDPQPGPQIDRKLRPIRADADRRVRHNQLGDRLLRQHGRIGWRLWSDRRRTVWHKPSENDQTTRDRGITSSTGIDLNIA